MVEIFLSPHPQLELFIVLNEIGMLMKKIAINTEHSMKNIWKYDEKIKG